MTAAEQQISDLMERQVHDVLRSQLAEMERLGMGHIPYAVHVQRCLDRFAEREAPRSPMPTRPSLRLVTT